MPPARCAKCKTPRWNLKAADSTVRKVHMIAPAETRKELGLKGPTTLDAIGPTVADHRGKVSIETHLIKLCEHGAAPGLCKYAKCRKT